MADDASPRDDAPHVGVEPLGAGSLRGGDARDPPAPAARLCPGRHPATAEQQARVWARFYSSDRRIQSGSYAAATGLGLGLAISKALIEMQGGSLTARSEGRNQGSAFVVELPVTVPAPRLRPPWSL